MKIIDDETLSELERVNKPKFESLRKGEEVIVLAEKGYLFHSGDGNVKYRTYAEHNQEAKGDQFVEPAPKQPISVFNR